MSDSFMSKIRSAISGSPQEEPNSEADELQIQWGPNDLPWKAADLHFMVMGSTGSGKTTMLRRLMQSTLPHLAKRPKKARAFVYDAKREYISLIYGMYPEANVIIVNPFDERTYAWDISADVTRPRHAQAVASILIPDEKQSTQRFFPDAARSLLASVMSAFALSCPGKWRLRDVLLTLRCPDRIRRVVARDGNIEDKARSYLNDEKTLPSVLSTLSTKLDPFEVVAALWEKAHANGQVFRLSNWIESESILVLGGSPANRASIDPINQAIFRRMSDLLLEQPNQPAGSTWLFLDEAREAGKLDGLSSLLNQGRSKGVTAVIGFQEIDGMEEVYGEKVAGEICGQCAHKMFLRTNSHKTAEWIQRHCGEYEEMEEEYTETHGRDFSESFAPRRRLKHAVLASEMLSIPPTNSKNGFFACIDVPGRPLLKALIPWKDVVGKLEDPSKREKDADEAPWKSLPAREETLKLWDSEDEERLKITRTAADLLRESYRKQDAELKLPSKSPTPSISQ